MAGATEYPQGISSVGFKYWFTALSAASHASFGRYYHFRPQWADVMRQQAINGEDVNATLSIKGTGVPGEAPRLVIDETWVAPQLLRWQVMPSSWGFGPIAYLPDEGSSAERWSVARVLLGLPELSWGVDYGYPNSIKLSSWNDAAGSPGPGSMYKIVCAHGWVADNTHPQLCRPPNAQASSSNNDMAIMDIALPPPAPTVPANHTRIILLVTLSAAAAITLLVSILCITRVHRRRQALRKTEVAMTSPVTRHPQAHANPSPRVHPSSNSTPEPSTPAGAACAVFPVSITPEANTHMHTDVNIEIDVTDRDAASVQV